MAEAELTNHAVPATNDQRPLEVRPELLPERAMTTQRVTDPLPPALIERVGQLILTDEQKAILMAPIPEDEIDIRFDGFIYVSHEYCRRKLFETFGPLGWNMIEASPLVRYPNTDEWYQKWALVIGGVFAGVSMSGMRLMDKNPNQDLSDVFEKIQSDCLRRICGKTLGIGIEAWNKRRQKEWRDKYAIRVLTRDWQGNQKIQWRRPDADPFVDGRTGKSIEIMAPYVDPPLADTKPTGQTKPPPPATETKASPPPKPPSPAAEAKPATPPPRSPARPTKLLPAQVRAIESLMLKAGLIQGEDTTAAMDWLAEREALAIVVDDNKSGLENLREMIAGIPAVRVTDVAHKLEALAKEKKD